jgi:hypothetical protein
MSEPSGVHQVKFHLIPDYVTRLFVARPGVGRARMLDCACSLQRNQRINP